MNRESDYLRVLSSQARTFINEDFRATGVLQSEMDGFTAPFERDVDLQNVGLLLEECMSKPWKEPAKSDEWLSPRLYIALRLTPREASIPALWEYLSVLRFNKYVRWRWQNDYGIVAAKRYVGPKNQQAFARLWWAAEMLRNGNDYSACRAGFVSQDIPNTLLSLRLWNSKAVAIASVEYLLEKSATSDNVNDFSTALRAAAVTCSIDRIAPAEDVGEYSVLHRWISEPVFIEDILSDTLTHAPEDAHIPRPQIDLMRELITAISPLERSAKKAAA